MKTVRLNDGHIEAKIAIRPVKVAGAEGRFVQIEGENFCITLTDGQAQQLATTLLRMSA